MRSLSTLAVLALIGCSSAPAPLPEAPAQEPAAPLLAVSAAPAVVASAAPEELPSSGPAPAPLTQAEQKEANGACKPLMDAVQRAKGSGKGPLDALEEALKKPAGSMKPAQVERCRELLGRGIRTYLAAAGEVEATVIFQRIGGAVAMSHGQTGKLCPSSERPVPADRALVSPGPHQSTEEEWNTPSWKCLGFSLAGQAQRFQYEFRAGADGKTFSVIARGTPGGDGRWVELFVEGKIGPRAVEISAVKRR